MTRKIVCLLLVALLVFPFAACGGKTPETNESEPNAPVLPTVSIEETDRFAFDFYKYLPIKQTRDGVTHCV